VLRKLKFTGIHNASNFQSDTYSPNRTVHFSTYHTVAIVENKMK